jgi:hypothetical protein
MFLVVVYPMLDHLDHLVGLGRPSGMLRGFLSGAMPVLMVLMIVMMLMMVMEVSVAIFMIMVMMVAHCLDPPWLRLTQ